ncbi:uncharacterized protein TrAFT101_007313 [Trichoderma asperellum]|uniref:uncharacterized protein n=1 Tax=Trichoderma asperellum TaxID=101201 RepID=UPI0033333BF4|nr:hypothetical protein TrAFT101_007313 [Trichoderma asperellum]
MLRGRSPLLIADYEYEQIPHRFSKRVTVPEVSMQVVSNASNHLATPMYSSRP